MIKSIYQSLLPSHTRNSIRKIFGYTTYNPIKKGKLKNYIYIHIPKTGGTSISEKVGKIEHRTAKEIIEITGYRKWKTSFKFSFVRNPWDLVYSHYKFKLKHNHQNIRTNNIEFNTWVSKIYGSKPDLYYRHNPKMYTSQSQWLLNFQNKIELEYIGRFEDLASDYKKIAEVIGVDSELGHLNKTAKDNYRSAYSSEAKQLVETAFAEDIMLWEFKF